MTNAKKPDPAAKPAEPEKTSAKAPKAKTAKAAAAKPKTRKPPKDKTKAAKARTTKTKAAKTKTTETKAAKPKKAKAKAAPSGKVEVKRGRRRLYNRAPDATSSEPPDSPAAAPSREVIDEQSRQLTAQPIVQKYTTAAVLAAVVPLPAVDIAAVTAIQLQLLRSLARLYEVPFSENLGKALVASLLGGLGTVAVGTGVVGSLLKVIPGIGTLLGPLAVPATAGAATCAVGRVFIQHFEAGGTFLDFDPQKRKAHFERLYRQERRAQ